MTEAEYVDQLQAVLSQHSTAAAARIANLLKAIPAEAKQLDLEIFPGQDEDGFFTIRASLDGPDLYVLNKAIADQADFFDVRYTDFGVEPPIPLVNAPGFPVNDVLVDCAAAWLQGVWESLGSVECRVPVWIVAHDDYGTLTPIDLHDSD